MSFRTYEFPNIDESDEYSEVDSERDDSMNNEGNNTEVTDGTDHEEMLERLDILEEIIQQEGNLTRQRQTRNRV